MIGTRLFHRYLFSIAGICFAVLLVAVADSVIVYNYRMGTVFAAYSGIYPADAYPDQDLIDTVRDARAHGDPSWFGRSSSYLVSYVTHA